MDRWLALLWLDGWMVGWLDGWMALAGWLIEQTGK
jgi:hypothetical protein